jgi:hypothetical protein
VPDSEWPLRFPARSLESGDNLSKDVTALRLPSPGVTRSYAVFCAAKVALSRTSNAFRDLPATALPSTTGPPHRDDTSSSRPGPDPLQSTSSPPDRPTSRPVSTPSSSAALQRYPRASPIWSEPFQAPLRFRSQAFSTSQRFPSKLEFHGLIPCRNRSWASPFRVFPSQESRTPLGATCSLAVIHRRAGVSYPRPCHRQFPRRPCLTTQLPGSPDDYGSPFSEHARFPVALDRK